MKSLQFAFLNIFLLIPILLLCQKTAIKNAGYEITLKVKGINQGKMFLAHYTGDKTFLADSAEMKNGVCVFKGEKPLPCGIYMIAKERMKLFEFLVKEQKFTIITDTSDYVKFLKVNGSIENEIFLAYQQRAGELNIESYYLRERYKAAEKSGNTVLVEKMKDTIRSFTKKEKEYYKSIQKDKPNSLLAKITSAMTEVEIPTAAKNEKGQLIDTSIFYQQFLKDYWRPVDFSCECLAYTPIYESKLKTFFERYVIPQPDTIIRWADYVVEKSKASKELFKQTVQYITNTYANNQYLCMDAVPVHMILKYYTYDQCFWLDSANIQASRLRAESVYPTLCNHIAPDIEMHDSVLEKQIIEIVKRDSDQISRSTKIYNAMQMGGIVSLHSVKAEYTILMFWDPDCSHCKAEMPKIKEVYNKYKNKNVAVYAACVEQEYDKWVNYIKANNLEWINVIDAYNISEFRKYYDISSTPVILLLDKNKKIIAKKLGAESLEMLLKYEFKESASESEN